MTASSRLVGDLLRSHADLFGFIEWYESAVAAHPGADMVLGNPQEMPLPALTAAIAKWGQPKHKDWYAYTTNDSGAQRAIVASLATRRGMLVAPEDVHLTNGAFAGLTVALRALCDPGDEVIYLSPPWFFYVAIIQSVGAVAVRVPVDATTSDIDLSAVAGAITSRTRAIIVNSPNNPTGVMYPRATLDALAEMLTNASRRNGRPIFLVSDEAYSRIMFGGRRYESPVASYPRSLLIYTYGKQLLAPGERIGYIALAPAMDPAERDELRGAITMSQFVTGFAFPNAVLQYALPELEDLSIDLAHLERKRDRVVNALKDSGYDVRSPEGTFYLLPRSPWPDDMAFVRHLGTKGVYVLPGRLAEIPGRFRISLTASDAMIDAALPVLAAAAREPRPT